MNVIPNFWMEMNTWGTQNIEYRRTTRWSKLAISLGKKSFIYSKCRGDGIIRGQFLVKFLSIQLLTKIVF